MPHPTLPLQLLLLNLFVAGDDLLDTVDEAVLVIGDEVDEDEYRSISRCTFQGTMWGKYMYPMKLVPTMQ